MKASALIMVLSEMMEIYGNKQIVFKDDVAPNCLIARGIDGEICYSLEYSVQTEIDLQEAA